MKYFKILLLLATLNLNANSISQKTAIKEITVCINGAQITRTATITIPEGISEVVFTNLSTKIDESSIQLSGLQKASILAINFGVNYLDKPLDNSKIKDLKALFEQLNDKVMFEEHLILGYNEEIDLIKANRQLGNETENVTLDKVRQFSEYYRIRLTELKDAIYKSMKNINAFGKEIAQIKKQLTKLNVTDKIESGEIKVRFNADHETSLSIVLKYNISDAGWFPVYDIKAEKVNAPINLTYKAHVYQNSGIDWNDTKLTLSTSDPNTNNEKPELNPKYLNILSRYSSYKSQSATKRYNYRFNPFIKTVSGVVLDGDGKPLPGVNVLISGTTTGTQTDFDGKYSLNVENGKELTFSFIGMQSEILPIHASVINVNLEEDLTALDEVAVTGYGISRKKDIRTSAVASVSSEELSGGYSYKSSDDIARALSGKVAGLTITSNSGSMGSSPNIRIRGMSSLSGMNNPLYIIDGVPIDSNSYKNIDPDNLESIAVLKASEATSLYGAKGGNGVILITTKDSFTNTGDIIEEGITNVKFELQKRQSITSNNDISVIKVDEFNIQAEYSYFASPVINENVFLTAKFDNSSRYNLLPGEANIYFEGIYAGKTSINTQIIREKITVSLGIDPNVIAKRTQSNDFKNKSFMGSNRIINKAYELEIKNNKGSDIALVLMDRIPISQNKEIKVDDIGTGNAKYDNKKGILTWELNIPAGSKATDKISYTIKYPKHRRINL